MDEKFRTACKKPHDKQASQQNALLACMCLGDFDKRHLEQFVCHSSCAEGLWQSESIDDSRKYDRKFSHQYPCDYNSNRELRHEQMLLVS